MLIYLRLSTYLAFKKTVPKLNIIKIKCNNPRYNNHITVKHAQKTTLAVVNGADLVLRQDGGCEGHVTSDVN